MSKIKILLIEDNRILRDGIARLIKKQIDIDVVAVSDGKPSTFAKFDRIQPDVVLMDMGISSHNSLEIITEVKAKFLDVKVLGMGLVPAPEDIMEFVQAGADGFVLKTGTVDDIIISIRKVYQGETVLPRIMSRSLFSQVVESALVKGKRNLKMSTRMTEREKEIMALIEEGMSNKKIGDILCISTYTVKSHVHNVMEKLALHSRLQIANYSRTTMVE